MSTRDLTKSIIFDPETLDYAMYLGGELVGFAARKDEAERRLDDLVYRILSHEAGLAEAPERKVATPAEVVAACTAMAEEFEQGAAAHKAQGNAEAAKDLASAARAARKAAFYAIGGAQVARWAGEELLVRSATDGGAVYAVRSAGCQCKAAENNRSCWHVMLRLGHERALDVIDQRPVPGGLVLAA